MTSRFPVKLFSGVTPSFLCYCMSVLWCAFLTKLSHYSTDLQELAKCEKKTHHANKEIWRLLPRKHGRTAKVLNVKKHLGNILCIQQAFFFQGLAPGYTQWVLADTECSNLFVYETTPQGTFKTEGMCERTWTLSFAPAAAPNLTRWSGLLY